jgi:hypothetical protein
MPARTLRCRAAPCLSMLDVAPPEFVAAAAGAGFDAVGLRVAPVTPGEEAWPVFPAPRCSRSAGYARPGLKVGDEIADAEWGVAVQHFGGGGEILQGARQDLPGRPARGQEVTSQVLVQPL